MTAISLGPPSRTAANDLPEDLSAGRAILLLGLPPGGVCRATPLMRGAVSSYLTVSPLPSPREAVRRFDFCGTFPVLANGGRYPPPCPEEPGLSSRSGCCRRLSRDQAGTTVAADELDRKRTRTQLGKIVNRRLSNCRTKLAYIGLAWVVSLPPFSSLHLSPATVRSHNATCPNTRNPLVGSGSMPRPNSSSP